MKVLLVEDDASLREGMGELISDMAEVREVGSVSQALVALKEDVFDLVLTDLRIGQSGDGGRVIVEAARRRLQPVVLVSAATSEEVRRALGPFEPDAVLAKPFQIDDVVALVERFLGLRREVEALWAARGKPPAEGWVEVSEGVRVAEAEPGRASWGSVGAGDGLPPSDAWWTYRGAAPGRGAGGGGGAARRASILLSGGRASRGEHSRREPGPPAGAPGIAGLPAFRA